MNADSDSPHPLLPSAAESGALVSPGADDAYTAPEAMWRVVPSQELYEASDDGRIRLAATGRELEQHQDEKGYFRVNIRRASARGNFPRYVHRLMALAFFGPQPTAEHTDVAHWDGDPSNNTIANLRWATPHENAQDKIRHGRTR